jgi:spore maturation protein CgeB
MMNGETQQSRSFPASLADLRVLFVSGLTPDYYGAFRLATLRRLGLAEVIPLDHQQYNARGLLGKLQFRTQVGVEVRRFNRDVLGLAQEHQVHLAWFDKALSLWPETLRELRRRGVSTVDYVNDNPFGPRSDPGWRLYRKTQPWFDLHAVPRTSSIADYKKRGAQNVMPIRFTYEPTVHFLPPENWSDAERTRQVSFIGTPYDDRADFLSALSGAGAPLSISGSEPHWRAALPVDVFAATFRDGELKAAAYREAIWKSKINLTFVTKANRDEVAHKSFEIAACGGFLLAERTPGHLSCFKGDEEAVFFSSVEECAAKIRRYLPDEQARARIAAAGQRRAATSGYDNDSMMRTVLERALALWS